MEPYKQLYYNILIYRTPLHNSKQLINEFITTVDLFNENIIKEYREKREREQRWINMHNSEKELQKKLQKENDKYLFWLVVVIIIIVIISNFKPSKKTIVNKF